MIIETKSLGGTRAPELGTVGYVAPVFWPAIGGGVVYLDRLSKYLLADQACERFIIVTESFPGRPSNEAFLNGKLQVIRKYPFRAGRNIQRLSSYFYYCWQNLLFFTLVPMVRKKSIDILMVHGSFLNNPSSILLVLRMVQWFSPNTKIVADLRDPKLPLQMVPKLRIFDLIISCSENISQRIASDSDVYAKLRNIPVIVDVTPPDEETINSTRIRYGLEDRSYVFNGSGMLRGKGVNRIFDLVSAIRRRGSDISLVVVGKRRYWDSRFEQAAQEGWFHYLGQVSQEDVLALAAGAWVDVNLSHVDSMPRHSLEAIFAGARVIVPSGIPEFERACPDNVANEESIEDLASKVMKIAGDESYQCGYCIESHRPAGVIRSYVAALGSIL